MPSSSSRRTSVGEVLTGMRWKGGLAMARLLQHDVGHEAVLERRHQIVPSRIPRPQGSSPAIHTPMTG
jgi:hypothetical protein